MEGFSFTNLFRKGSAMGVGEGEQEAMDELIASLPQEEGSNLPPRCLYQNFWCPVAMLPNVVALQRHFKAKGQDIVLASPPKSGTTWLKAITFSIVNRSRFDISSTPLLTSNPHELIPSFEFLFGHNPRSDLDDMEEPRLFATHLPYPSLPTCIRQSNCRIIYICRNPLDTIVSSWIFTVAMARAENRPEWSLEKHFEAYCQGKLGFLEYEDLKRDVVGHLKKVAEFMGLPFSKQEEEGGVTEDIAKICSLKTLKDLEVNKSGKIRATNLEKRSFFRKGEMGDWVNHLTPSMVDRLNSIMQEKLSPFGLQFRIC